MPGLADAVSSFNDTLVIFTYVSGAIITIGFSFIILGPFFSIIKDYFKYKINLIKSNKILKLENSFETVINNINLIEFQIKYNTEFLKRGNFYEQLHLINEKLKLKHVEFNEVLIKVKDSIK